MEESQLEQPHLWLANLKPVKKASVVKKVVIPSPEDTLHVLTSISGEEENADNLMEMLKATHPRFEEESLEGQRKEFDANQIQDKEKPKLRKIKGKDAAKDETPLEKLKRLEN